MEKSWGRLAARACLTKTAAEVPSHDMGRISWFGPCTVASLDGNNNANKCQGILKDYLWPVVIVLDRRSNTKLKTIFLHFPGLLSHPIST